ncbi:PTS mannose transporter subunit IIABC [Corynebacterium poyangense]|uniref:PTS mannose transporter subunit IIABC n=1 Tax=Corynebacterium poyangense TaxID=2684405 RepID=A0A7H0SRQ6_9CORY|nr:fructose-specific PTS transporter subunit EIIC [Corynebacterium poyangense]MBZ8176664.1 PTS transporter subunit EIIA [Corynebacterium poyangense]QNQ91231.1 PTS mannose transporter subunit IIABC [Corynebacterium poyangense]
MDNDEPLVLAITACPTGIAHTYLAAENLEAAAAELGIRLRVETHGSIGVEGTFSKSEIQEADAVLIAADTSIERSRFHAKRLLATGVDAAIKDPRGCLEKALSAPVASSETSQHDEAESSTVNGDSSGLKTVGITLYRALMSGVSHMVPFVVTGGLLLAIALSLGGQPTTEGLAIPEDSWWKVIEQVGTLAFSLMVPVLSAFIAQAIADRPGLAPGFITGLIAVNGELYGSETGTGFIGGIITGILAGYVALGIRKIPVNKYVAPIWPIIVIPILTTLIVGLLFIYIIGHPVAALFEALTRGLAGLDGGSAIILGAVIGAMIAFDMGGPFNKTAFLFGGGLIAAGNPHPMGMAAAAIAVPPLAVGVATLIRRHRFSQPERDSGIAALFMGCFGITEGAIPLAAARPLHVIPANVAGGAIAGALAGWWGVTDHVMHGGPIVAVLGAVDGVAWFFLALACGVAVNAGLIMLFVGREPTPSSSSSALISEDTVLLDVKFPDSTAAITAMVDSASHVGRINDPKAVVSAALERERKGSTAVGHGVAIPHARCAGVSAPVLVCARTTKPGVEWNTPDDSPARLLFLIAVPEGAGNQHLKILAKLAKALARRGLREEILNAENKTQIVRAIQKATHSDQVSPHAFA